MSLRIARRALAAAAILACATAVVTAADWPQCGPDRTGVSGETGLLAAWPAGGPRLAWRVADLEGGYSTPAVAGEHLFVQVNRDLTAEFLQARGRWAYAESPLVDGDAVIASPGARTALVALDARTGVDRWRTTVPGGEEAAYASTVVGAAVFAGTQMAGGGLGTAALAAAKAWAHPVVANGRLHLRQAGVLWAYDIAAKAR